MGFALFGLLEDAASTLRSLPFPGLGGGELVHLNLIIIFRHITTIITAYCYTNGMDIEEKIREILFNIGKEIKIHTIGKDMIIEIDYDKYVEELIQCYDEYREN